MKELKAIEILKAYAKCRDNERILMYPLNEVYIAIKELEEINSISCDGCIYNTYAFENEQCIYCSRRCVDFYEAKGE